MRGAGDDRLHIGAKRRFAVRHDAGYGLGKVPKPVVGRERAQTGSAHTGDTQFGTSQQAALQELVRGGQLAVLDAVLPAVLVDVVEKLLQRVGIVRQDIAVSQHIVREPQAAHDQVHGLERRGDVDGEFLVHLGILELLAAEQLSEHPLHRTLLHLAGHALVARSVGTVPAVVDVDSAHVAPHRFQIELILFQQLGLHALAVRPVGVVVRAYPRRQVVHDIFQIADAVLSGADRVVAQVLAQSRGVETIERCVLQCGVPAHRVAGMPGDPRIERRPLLRGVGHEPVKPADGILVVNAHLGRREPHALVAGLRHVVETGVIHDRSRRAVFLRERRRAQRIDRDGRRSGHVVGEPQAVAHLMGGDIGQRLVHHLPGHHDVADPGVDLRRLHETPAVDLRGDVLVQDHRGAADLARAGIGPEVPFGILDVRRSVPDARGVDAVGIERGVVLREVLHADHLPEPGLLESPVPAQNAALHRLAPRLGHIRVHVHRDRAHRVRELAAQVGRRIRRNDVPACGVLHLADRPALLGEHLLFDREQADAVVGRPGPHAFLGHGNEREDDIHIHGQIDSHRKDEPPFAHAVLRRSADVKFAVQAPDIGHAGQAGLHHGRNIERIVSFADRGEFRNVRAKELRGVDHHGRPVVVADLDPVLPHDVVAADRGDGRPDALRNALPQPGVVPPHQNHGAVLQIERDVHRRLLPEPCDASAHVHRRCGGRSQQHIPPHRGQRNLEEDLAVDLVQGDQLADGGRVFPAVEKFFVGRFPDGLFLSLLRTLAGPRITFGRRGDRPCCRTDDRDQFHVFHHHLEEAVISGFGSRSSAPRNKAWPGSRSFRPPPPGASAR